MPNDNTGRDRYRDNDDVRGPLASNARGGTNPDTRAEARGDAREAVGNTSRDTDTNVTGPEESDKTRDRPTRDQFDQDLDED